MPYGAEDLFSLYRSCRLCPRECGVDRTAGRTGVCGMPAALYAARAALHEWEEPCLSGEPPRGSGTVFFSGCCLRCGYCQNRDISRGRAGREISAGRLAEIFLELQDKGAYNINLVTPTHYLPHIVCALREAKENGLHLPVVYNTSGYERPQMLRLLAGLVDVWLPDLKYKSSELSSRYSYTPDYFTHAAAALDEMVRQAGEPQFDADGMMTRGVIVRHLCLPGQGEDSRAVIRWLWERYRHGIFLSLMSQYTPLAGVEQEFPELARRLTGEEYERLVDFAVGLGVENGFIQEGSAAKESFIPAFDGEGIDRAGGKEG